MRKFTGHVLPHICKWEWKAEGSNRTDSFTAYLHVLENYLKRYMKWNGKSKVFPVHIKGLLESDGVAPPFLTRWHEVEVSGKFHPAASLPVVKELPLPMATEQEGMGERPTVSLGTYPLIYLFTYYLFNVPMDPLQANTIWIWNMSKSIKPHRLLWCTYKTTKTHTHVVWLSKLTIIHLQL
jgi:hypothetical protein